MLRRMAKIDCYDNGSCVDSKRDDDKCLSFAYTYAYDLLHGTTTCDHCASQYKRSGFADIKTFSKEDTLSMIYDQLSHGWPVVVQVKYSNGSGRHFVTAVGYKSSVTSRENFTENDILFLNTSGALWQSTTTPGKVMRRNGSEYTTKYSMPLFSRSDYGYRVLPLKNPNPDAKASNITNC